ncbi:MAG TPA: ABC transporter substrate-binding protein [Candidatus Nitrosotalea sp.]|nr:ABC transporter substrate-binding protein [Candidatus Nitrosotalea sp.]
MNWLKRIAVMGAMAALVAACGGSTPAATSKTSVDTTSFGFGADSTPDESYLPILMALDQMRKDGYNVPATTQLNGTSLVIQAVANDQLQLFGSGVIQVATAIKKGIPLTAISARNNNTWSLVTTSDITSCSQLSGKKVAIFSTGGTSTAYLKIYFAKNCPSVKPTYLIIADSTLRRQALENGQVVAAPLEGADTVSIVNSNPSKFHVLASMAKELPGVGRDVVTTSPTFVKDHPSILKAFVKDQLLATRSLYKSPALVRTETAKYFNYGAQADAIGKFFTSTQQWCANGGLQTATMDNQLQTFESAGKIPAGVTTSQVVNDSIVKAVLKQIGTSSATTC